MKNAKLLLLVASASLLAGCGKSSNTPKVDPYKDVNEALETVYVSFEMDVKTVKGGYELNSHYSFQFNGANYKVDYSKESYNELSTDSQASQKSTEEGSYNVNVEEATLAKFKVSDDAFSNVEYEAGSSFVGTAKDGKAFLGVDYAVTDLTLTVELDDGLSKVEYSYTASGAQNIITYSNFVE